MVPSRHETAKREKARDGKKKIRYTTINGGSSKEPNNFILSFQTDKNLCKRRH